MKALKSLEFFQGKQETHAAVLASYEMEMQLDSKEKKTSIKVFAFSKFPIKFYVKNEG